MKTKFTTIKCPYCDREYLPGEIYVPNSFLGQPKNIEKDYSGKIIDFSGSNIDLEEYYQCDKCGKSFKVTAHVSFTVTRDAQNDFSTEYVTKLPHKNTLFQ